MIAKWQSATHLVSPASFGDVWRRHILDSVQLLALAPASARTWIDIGSGAGFPGLVLAIMGAPEVHLVESNARKCAFLAVAARVTAAPVVIHRARIEALAPWPVDVVTARAVAPLARLCGLAHPFVGRATVCLFPKGRSAARELTDAGKYWKMTVEQLPSLSDPDGSVLRLRGLKRA